jgi:hypothetical protein
MVHVESYKKLTLIALVEGKEFKLPKKTPGPLQKQLRLENSSQSMQEVETTSKGIESQTDFKTYWMIQNSWSTQNSEQLEQTIA